MSYTNSSNERSFSVIERIKTRLGSRSTQDKLDILVLLMKLQWNVEIKPRSHKLN